MDALRRRPQPPGGDRPAATVAAAVGALLDLLQRPRHPFLGRDQLLDHAYIGEAADRLGGAVADPLSELDSGAALGGTGERRHSLANVGLHGPKLLLGRIEVEVVLFTHRMHDTLRALAGHAHTIALLPGDGVGPEVIGQARRVVDASGVEVRWEQLDWGSERYRREGALMPGDALERLRRHDAILLGAVGDPSLPDDLTLWGLLLPIRQQLDLWANLRPVRLLQGVPGPLAGRGPADVDMLFVRENTEGEYSGIGGRAHVGLPGETAIETSVFTRSALERLLRHAFELAQRRRGVLTSATKSNASRFGFVLWDEVAEEVASEFPGVGYERVLVDALASRMVGDPGSLDVVVASNLFGDILTDLGAALQGGMGMAASANLKPDGGAPGLFEPVHGSAPDIAGRGVANPCGAIWSAALMLADLGEAAAAERVMGALERVCLDGPRSRDIGGSASTAEVGDAVVRIVAAGAAD